MASHNRLELVGDRFGRLTVMGFDGLHTPPSGGKKTKWICLCDCGSRVSVFGSSLTTGNTSSCGCASRESTAKRNQSHGMSRTRTYRIWQAMLNRCRNPNMAMYPRYGGRGIRVCSRWESFENFYADMGECPKGMSIDRINNDANYEPGNCRWANRRIQSRNKSSNRIISYGGRRLCLTDWAKSLSMDQASLAERIEKWGVARALTTPKGRSHGITKSMSIHR